MLSRLLLIIFLTVGLYSLYDYYKTNLSGAWPAINPTSKISTLTPTTNTPSSNSTGLPLILPPQISISIFAKNVVGARDLEFDSQGTLFVSQPGLGKVIAIPEQGRVVEVLTGLNRPHGLAFSGNTLFVAETNSVSTYDYDPSAHAASDRKKIIDLPVGGNHWTRSLLIKDNQLYISVGSTCNVCNESDSRRSKILVSNLDGSSLKSFASGLRNSVFLITHPLTNEIWATEMGRDLLGDDLPPDEINILTEGKDLGWPNCYGKNVPDFTFQKTNLDEFCEELFGTHPSHIDLPAHSAPLGLAFVPQSWPIPFRGQLLVAFHGSWNRTTPTGYKVVIIDSETGDSRDFISGWLKAPNDSYGRPVDLIFDSLGDLFISDDHAGVVYKVSRP